MLHAGKNAEWSRKVQLALKSTDSKYICLLLEDFHVGKTIDTKVVHDTVSYIENEKIRYFKLTNMSRAVKNKDPHYKNKSFCILFQKMMNMV